MNFLSLRSELQNWTLSSDDKLYRAIKQLSDTVLEAEKLIINNIQTTRYEAIRGQVESGCSYNHYLRISETKFTENKIGDKATSDKKQDNTIKPEPKSKMDIFKEAIDIGTKNLQITEEKGADNDLVSISDTALSQSIYRDCRVPAFYGTKQFAINSFLNLFTNNELNTQVPTQKFETNQLVMNQMQESEVLPPPPSLTNLSNQYDPSLLPPPSLEHALNSAAQLPPPPPPSLVGGFSPLPPPPPPPSLLNLNLPPPPSISSPQQPVSPQVNAHPSAAGSSSELDPTPRAADVPPATGQSQRQEERIQASVAPASKPKQLSIQEQLALRFKHGKNYKKQIEVDVEQPQTKQVIVPQVASKSQNRLPIVQEQRQTSERANRNSFRNSIGINLNPLANSITPTKSAHDEPEQEQADSFFGPSKNKNKETKKPITIENDIMKRQTFNQDILFKKKPQPEKKEIVKPKNYLFGDEEQQQGDFTFKIKDKKDDPKQKSNPFAKEGKKKNILDEDSAQDNSVLFKIKTEAKAPLSKVQSAVPEKKILNPLFKPSQPIKDLATKTTELNKQKSERIEIEANRKIQQQKKESQIATEQESTKIQHTQSNQSNQSHASSYAMRMAAAGSQAMGMGMGMPIIPRGMVFTKPSETKRNEEEALKKLKQQEELQRISRQQQAKLQQKLKVQQQQKRQNEFQIQEKGQEQVELRNKQIKLTETEGEKKQTQISQQKFQEKKKAQGISSPIKKNALFDDEGDNQDIFKPKPKKESQKQLSMQAPTISKIQQIKPSPEKQIKTNEDNSNTKEINYKVEPHSEQSPLFQGQAGKGELSLRRKKAKPTFKSESLFAQDETEAHKTISASSQLEVKLKMEQEANLSKKMEAQKLKKQQQQKMERQRILIQQKKREQAEVRRQENQRKQRERQLQEQKKIQQQRRRKFEDQQRVRALEEQKRQEQLRKKKQFEAIEEKKKQQQRIDKQKKAKQQEKRQEQLRQEREANERAEKQRQAQEQQRIKQEAKKQPLLPLNQKVPFLPKLPTRSNQPLGGPSIPTLPKTIPKQPLHMGTQPKKSSLFNDDDEGQLTFNKSSKPAANKPSITSSNQKKGLFDDDDDLDNSNFLSSKKTAQTKVQPKVEKAIKNEDDTTSTVKTKIAQNEPLRQPAMVKQQAKKKSLFDDDDDLESNTFLKKPVNKTESVSPSPLQKGPVVQSQQPGLKQNKGLFNDDQEQTVVAKKPAVQKSPTPLAVSQKKGLFDDNDDNEDGFLSKKGPALMPPAQKKEAVAKPKKKNLFQDSGSDDDFSLRKRKA